MLYEKNPQDGKVGSPGEAVYEAAVQTFGSDSLRYDRVQPKGSAPDFPVSMQDGRIVASTALSATLTRLPIVSVEFVFIDPARRKEAERWLKVHRDDIIRNRGEVPENE